MTDCALPFKPELVAAAAERASPSESPRKPRDPAVTKLRRVMGCGIGPSLLMILRELTGTSQSPDKLAKSGFPIAAPGQNGFELFDLIRRRWTRQRGEVEFHEDLLIGGARMQQPCQAAIRPAQAVRIGGAGEHVQRLA